MIKQRPITTKTTTATLTLSEMGDIVCNSGSDFTVTLPTASGGLWYRVSNVGAGVVTVAYDATSTTLKQNEQALLLSNSTTAWCMSKGAGQMTKDEIEAVLTGEISSHTHAVNITKAMQSITLTSTNITNKYVDLANVPLDNTAVELFPVGGIKQAYTTDYTVITDGADIRRLNWDGLGLASLLAENDIISVDYIY